ncbi:MAG: gliding motility-associated C-terminal domain-containing protein, partial [Phaeodactylibacter sp.]|nr:gliding motility-associated C-terminal domain-containing protein [Phaeodactylibacter sp.]
PDNKVSIFNQWGDEVYQAAPYGNDWKGTYDGEDLPTGTYFFIVNLGDGSGPRTGFLVLQR